MKNLTNSPKLSVNKSIISNLSDKNIASYWGTPGGVASGM
jgi:hypothetical protein